MTLLNVAQQVVRGTQPQMAREVRLGMEKVWPAEGGISDTIMAHNPVAYWPLDDSSGSPQDISGNGHHLTASGTLNYRVALTNGVLGIHGPATGTAGRLESGAITHPTECTYLVYVQDVEGSMGSPQYNYMGNWSTRTMLLRRVNQNAAVSNAQVYLNPPSGQTGGTIGPSVDWAQGVLLAVTAGQGGYSVMVRCHDGQSFTSDPETTWNQQWASDLTAAVRLFTRDTGTVFAGYALAHAAVIPARLAPAQVDDIWAKL